MTSEFKERLGAPTKASVEERPIQNIQPQKRRRSSNQALIARTSGRMDESDDIVTTSDGTGSVTHTRPGTYVMYKPTERSGWMAKTVSVSAISMLLKNGWQEFCPDCNGEHVDRNGNITTDPNACAGREPVAVRICPVCRKRLYDNMSLDQAIKDIDDDDDPNVIHDNAYAMSDPTQRTKQKLDLHLWVRHPEWAQANGVPPLPQAFREMVDQGLTAKGT